MRNLTRMAPALLAGAALLGGCGSRSAPTAAAAPARPASAPKVAAPADTLSRNMVTAASANKGINAPTPPVQLKFELQARPEVSQPLDISVVILPATNLDRLYGRVEGEDGLKLIEGGEIPTTDRPTEGVPITHSIKVVPQRNGIFAVNASVTTQLAGQTSSQTFSIPVIAGSGMPDLPTKAGGPRPTANRTATATAPTPPTKR